MKVFFLAFKVRLKGKNPLYLFYYNHFFNSVGKPQKLIYQKEDNEDYFNKI